MQKGVLYRFILGLDILLPGTCRRSHVVMTIVVVIGVHGKQTQGASRSSIVVKLNTATRHISSVERHLNR